LQHRKIWVKKKRGQPEGEIIKRCNREKKKKVLLLMGEEA